MASNLFNCRKEVINAPPVPSISRCIHIVYRHKNVWEYQWSNFIYNCMSTFLHYVHCKDALLDCSAPGGERCESLTWVDEIPTRVVFAPENHHPVWYSEVSATHMQQGSKLRGAEGQNAPKLSPNAPRLLNLGAKFCYPIQPDICFEA